MHPLCSQGAFAAVQVFLRLINLPHLILQVLLSNYEWSEEAVLPPKVLREALSNLFAKEGRFQINQMVHHAIHLPSTYSAFCLTHPRSRTMPWRLLTQSSPACTRAWPRNEKMAARTTASRLVLFIRAAPSVLQRASPLFLMRSHSCR